MGEPSVNDLLSDLEATEADEVAARAHYRNLRTKRAQAKQIRELNELVESLERDIATLQSLRPAPPPPKPLKPVKRGKAGKLPAAFVALASDWHTCELITAKQTNGRNVHDQHIGTERAWRWAQGVVRMCEDEMARADVKTLVLWLGGDFLVNDGLHYKGDRVVGMGPHEEARFIRDLLGQIIAYLRSELDVERISIVTSWGNHDRSTPKMVPGLDAEYSYIQSVYRDLAAWFAITDKTVEFSISESDWTTFDVHGYGLLFNHGHPINYKQGQGGPGVPLMRKFVDLMRDYDFETACIGHFHQRGMYRSGAAFTNGSLVGPNGYSRFHGLASEDPSQVAFMIDLERRAIANYYVIWGT